MSFTKHPPVLPVEDMIIRENREWIFFLETPGNYCIRANLKCVIGHDVYCIVAALQRCAWLDLRNEPWEKVLEVMRKVWPEEKNWYKDKAICKIEKTADAWAAWEKDW